MAKKLVVWWNSFSVLYCQLHFSPFLHHTLPPDCDPAEIQNMNILLTSQHLNVVIISLVSERLGYIQYIPRNMHTVFALQCFVVVIHWLIFPYPSGLLHWHCGNLTIASVPAKQPWWIWINTSCEFIMNDCITTTKQSTTKPCAYFLRYTVIVLYQSSP